MKKLQQTILVMDDVLSKEDCDKLIEIYDSKGPTFQWHSFFPLKISFDDSDINLYLKKILESFLLPNKIEYDWGQIVKWPKESFMSLHQDFSKKETIFTSVTYLNDDYEGGYTFFMNDFYVKPKVGRTVWFDGTYHTHGVSKITAGTRYTLPIWYK
jgi:hypothetical protein